MDVIIEGKITAEEGLDEILKTCAEIKSVNTPILRINDHNSDLTGRIGFSQGGYIIGGKIMPDGESGYAAVRKLLSVSEGNYAILDPLKKQVGDCNQSLWMKVEKIVPLVPNLPESPEGLIDPHPQGGVKVSQAQMELPKPGTFEKKKDEGVEAAPATVNAKSASRKFDLGFWRVFRAGMLILIGFTVVLSAALYRVQIIDFFKGLFGQ